MNVEIGTVATQFSFLGIIVSNFRNCGFAVQRLAYIDGKGVKSNETTVKKVLGSLLLYSLYGSYICSPPTASADQGKGESSAGGVRALSDLLVSFFFIQNHWLQREGEKGGGDGGGGVQHSSQFASISGSLGGETGHTLGKVEGEGEGGINGGNKSHKE